ncbi:hypothetical protein AAG570_007613 [Ranatra chinensis]|uniref:Uncharacterized protein n=1 Tax=Ranatra chinensis TaxID=642074 RepID=A0ABD0XU57_9HEMI
MRTRQLQEEEKALRLKEALDAKRREEALARATKDEKEQGQSKKTSKNQDQPTQATQKQHLSVPSSPGPQMVTIKRVMEPHNSEPTVTITLRGATPNQDKVLYTLLNGQVCKSTKLPFANGLATNSKNNGKLVPQNLAAQQQQCGKKNKLKKDFEMLQNSATIVPAPPAPTPTIVKISNPASIQIDSSLNKISPKSINPKPFNLDDIKLPPGITITKVDPSMVHSKNLLKERHPHKFPPISQIRSPPASEVIVVATGKLKEPTQLPQSKEIITHSTVVGGKKKKNKKKIDNIGAPMFNSNAVYPGVEIEPIDNILVKQHSIANAPTVSICPRIFQQHPTNQNQLSLSTQCLEQGRKKKKKIKKALANNNNINPEELSLLGMLGLILCF